MHVNYDGTLGDFSALERLPSACLPDLHFFNLMLLFIHIHRQIAFISFYNT